MNADEFRRAMLYLPEPPGDSLPPYWEYWRHDLWQRGRSQSVESFMAWPCIFHTMLVNHFPIGDQLAYLQQDDWKKWSKVVADPGSESNQRNLINQAYHLALWERTTGQRVDDLSNIHEFGGGYGAMALVANRAGFTGKYFITDLPEFELLQRWWLDQQGIEASWTDLPGSADLFIALYSLSETPNNVKWYWVDEMGANSYLVLYSPQFAEHDNGELARRIVAKNEQINHWSDVKFPGRPDRYLIGYAGQPV